MLLRASGLLKVLNRVAGWVSECVFVRRKCNWARCVYRGRAYLCGCLCVCICLRGASVCTVWAAYIRMSF